MSMAVRKFLCSATMALMFRNTCLISSAVKMGFEVAADACVHKVDECECERVWLGDECYCECGLGISVGVGAGMRLARMH